MRLALPAAAIVLAFLLSGCGEKKHARVYTPPPPVLTPPASPPAATPAKPAPEAPPAEEKRPSLDDEYADAVPISSETGYASWYGAPYHNRRAANGEVYDMHEMTAAHRTLPLNSIVRVTNLKTGSHAVLRITDRGPFVTDRIIDLSMNAAKALDIWRAGTAPVRIDVLDTPSPIDEGGRWAVQIGKFTDEETAARFKDKLIRRYRTAKVLEFAGPMHDWWVRVRVPDDDRKRAEQVARENTAPEGAIFLVRLD